MDGRVEAMEFLCASFICLTKTMNTTKSSRETPPGFQVHNHIVSLVKFLCPFLTPKPLKFSLIHNQTKHSLILTSLTFLNIAKQSSNHNQNHNEATK